jgi:predicted outer membrane repeat protein
MFQPYIQLHRFLSRCTHAALKTTMLLLALGTFVVLTSPSPVSAQARIPVVVGEGTPASCKEENLDDALAIGNEITFDCGPAPMTIFIGTTKHIQTDVTIDGGNLITLDGGGMNRLFYNQNKLTLKNLTLNNAATTTDGGPAVKSDYGSTGLTLDHVTVTNNFVDFPQANGGDGGGAIASRGGVLTITNSIFKNNHVYNGGGGAVHAVDTTMTITDTLFENNSGSKPGLGGAVFADGIQPGAVSGALVFQRVDFINNNAQGQGGAVFTYLRPNQPGSIVVFEDVNFINNHVTYDDKGDAFGGGLRHGNGIMLMDGVLFSGNSAQRQGGGIFIGEASNVKLNNATLTGNSAMSTDGKDGLGGGISIGIQSTIVINNSTIAYNQAGFLGGGIESSTTGSVLRNSIVAHNTAFNEWGINHNCTTTMQNGGGNLQDKPQNPYQVNDFECAQGITIGDPMLAPLADNGGYTMTHALMTGSPAIDKGNNNACELKDQRDHVRVGLCDMGAYEYDGVPYSTVDFLNNSSFEVSGPDKKYAESWKAKNLSGDKRICNKPDKAPIYEGGCVFTFKGKDGENSSLSQKLKPSGLIAGDQLALNLWMNAQNLLPGAVVQVKVSYTDDTKGELNIDLAGPPIYRRVAGNITLTGTPKKIKVSIKMKATGGKFFLDDVRLGKITLLTSHPSLASNPSQVNSVSLPGGNTDNTLLPLP